MHIKQLFALFTILVSSAGCIANNNTGESWWLSISFKPVDMQINGLHVSSFDKSWVSAKLIENEDIKGRINTNDYQSYLKSSFSFSKHVDLNGNGENEIFHVGVFRNEKNSQGIFLAVFEKGKLIKVLKDTKQNGFSTLLLKGQQLYWYRCMECGNFEQLVWTGSTYYLE